MKAVRIHEFGGPEVLKYEDIRDPALRKDMCWFACAPAR